MPPKSFEKLEQERKAASQSGVPSVPANSNTPGFEELNDTVPKAAPIQSKDVASINSNFKDDMRLSDMTGLPMSVIAEYREPMLEVEKTRIGVLEGLGQDPLFNIPFSGAVLEGRELVAIKLAGVRLNTDGFDWDEYALRRQRTLDWEYGKPRLAQTMSRAEYLEKRRAITGTAMYELDKAQVFGFIKRMAEREERGYTLFGRAATTVAQMPAWMLEIAATGGLFRTGSTVTKKFLSKYTKRKLVQTIGGGIVGTTYSVGAMPQRHFENIMKRSLFNEEHWGMSVAKGITMTWIEAGSERTGEALLAPLKRGLRWGSGTAMAKSPFINKFFGALQKEWLRLKPQNKAIDFANKMLKKGGYSSILGEVGEERVATILHGLVGTDTYGLKKGSWFYERIWAGLAEDMNLENFGAEIIAFSVPGGVKMSIGAAAGLPNIKLRKALVRGLGITDELARKFVKIKNRDNVIEAEKYLSQAISEGEKVADEKAFEEGEAKGTRAEETADELERKGIDKDAIDKIIEETEDEAVVAETRARLKNAGLTESQIDNFFDMVDEEIRSGRFTDEELPEHISSILEANLNLMKPDVVEGVEPGSPDFSEEDVAAGINKVLADEERMIIVKKDLEDFGELDTSTVDIISDIVDMDPGESILFDRILEGVLATLGFGGRGIGKRYFGPEPGSAEAYTEKQYIADYEAWRNRHSSRLNIIVAELSALDLPQFTDILSKARIALDSADVFEFANSLSILGSALDRVDKSIIDADTAGQIQNILGELNKIASERGEFDDRIAEGNTIQDLIDSGEMSIEKAEEVIQDKLRKVPEPSSAEALEEAEMVSFEKRFRDLSERVQRAEKTPTRQMSEEEVRILEEEGWEAYSRSRGYTKEEIEDFRKRMDAFAEGIELGFTVDDLADMERGIQIKIRGDKVEFTQEDLAFEEEAATLEDEGIMDTIREEFENSGDISPLTRQKVENLFNIEIDEQYKARLRDYLGFPSVEFTQEDLERMASEAGEEGGIRDIDVNDFFAGVKAEIKRLEDSGLFKRMVEDIKRDGKFSKETLASAGKLDVEDIESYEEDLHFLKEAGKLSKIEVHDDLIDEIDILIGEQEDLKKVKLDSEAATREGAPITKQELNRFLREFWREGGKLSQISKDRLDAIPTVGVPPGYLSAWVLDKIKRQVGPKGDRSNFLFEILKKEIQLIKPKEGGEQRPEEPTDASKWIPTGPIEDAKTGVPWVGILWRGTRPGGTASRHPQFGTSFGTTEGLAAGYGRIQDKDPSRRGRVDTYTVRLENPLVFNYMTDGFLFFQSIPSIKGKVYAAGEIAIRKYLEGKGYDGVIYKYQDISGDGHEVKILDPQKSVKELIGPKGEPRKPSDEIDDVPPAENDHRDGGFIILPPVTAIGKIEDEDPNIRIEQPRKDIGVLQKWLLTLGNQAHNSGIPLLAQAGDIMIDLGMHMNNDINAELIAGDHLRRKMPKEYKKNKYEKFFDLMDETWPPVKIAASDLPDTVKTALTYFKRVEEAMRLEVVRQKRLWALAILRNKSTTELLADAKEAGFELEEREDTIAGKKVQRLFNPATNQFMTKNELLPLLARKMVPDDWGRQWSHIHHAFFGQWQLQWREVDPESGEVKNHFIGRAETQTEAYQKLHDWKVAQKAAGREDVDQLDLVASPDIMMPYDMLRLGRKHYFALQAQLKEAGKAAGREVTDATKGIIGLKESKQKFLSSLLYRKGVEGYSKDFWKVWSAEITQFYRWKYLTEMNKAVEPMIEQIKGMGLRGWAQYLEDTKDFMWGRARSQLSINLDRYLSEIPLIRNYARPFALERWIGIFKTINYHRHLQTFRFAMVNKLQIMQTLWPVVGEAGMYRGIKLYFSKEGQELLRKYHVAGTSGKLHEQGMRPSRRFEKYTPAGFSEAGNQGLAFVTIYAEGIRQGMDEVTAARYARLRGQIMTQFAQSPADVPKLMRGPLGSLILQYKRFPIKNLELVARMARERNWAGVGKWLAALLTIGGANVFAGVVTSLPGIGYISYKIYKRIKERYGPEIADFIYYGLPGLVGIDLSTSVTPIDVPFGTNIYEKTGNVLFGPTGTTAVKLITDVTRTDVVKDIGLVPRGLKSLVDSSNSVKQFVFLVKAVQQDTSNFDAKQRALYELETWDLWKKAFGFRPLSESVQRAQHDAMLDLQYGYDATLSEIALALVEGDDTRVNKLIEDWQVSFPEAPLSGESIAARLKSKIRSRELVLTRRGFNNLPNNLKPIFVDDIFKENE